MRPLGRAMLGAIALASAPIACEPSHAATGDPMPQLGANLFLEDFVQHDQATRWSYGYTLYPDVIQDRTTAAGTAEVGVSLDGNFLGLGITACKVGYGFLTKQVQPLSPAVQAVTAAAANRAVTLKQMSASYGARVAAVRQATCMMQTKATVPVAGTVFQARAQVASSNGDWSAPIWAVDWKTAAEWDFVEHEPRWSGPDCYYFSEHQGSATASIRICPGAGDLSKAMHSYGGYIDGDYAVAIFDGREVARLKNLAGWKPTSVNVITNLAEGPLGYAVAQGHVGNDVTDWIRADARK